MFSPYRSQPLKKANNTLFPRSIQDTVGREEAQMTNPVSQHYFGEERAVILSCFWFFSMFKTSVSTVLFIIAANVQLFLPANSVVLDGVEVSPQPKKKSLKLAIFHLFYVYFFRLKKTMSSMRTRGHSKNIRVLDKGF